MANSYTYDNNTAQIVVSRQNVLFLATVIYDDTSRVVAHGLKDGNSFAIEYAAKRMSGFLPKESVIVPVPGRHGYALQTLELARAISKISGTEVCDVLKGNARRSNYECKKDGHPLTAEELGFRMEGCIPEGKVAVLVDNCVDRGVTAMAAADVLGHCVVLSYAMTEYLL